MRKFSILTLQILYSGSFLSETMVVFEQVNGEIYNHEKLRKQLSHHKFRTGSDCEVIAHLVRVLFPSFQGFIGFYAPCFPHLLLKKNGKFKISIILCVTKQTQILKQLEKVF